MRASRFRCTMGRAVACIPGIISCLALAQTHAVEWTAVERQYRKCVQENVDSSGCAVRHADALAHLGQPWDAILELESFVAAHPSDAPAVELYAELLQRVAKDVSGAERALRKATELTPGDPSLWRTLGALYAGQQKAPEAVRCYEQALRLRPDDPLYLAGLAYSHGLNGEQEQAEREFRRALALNERLPHPSGDVPVLYGVFLRNAGSAAESIPQFTQALRWNARSWRIYYERALACERTGDLARAEADALQALAGAGERRDPGPSGASRSARS